MAVAGASRFINSATLANLAGIAPSTPSALGNVSSSLLDAGRRINRSGIGLSPSARALNEQFLNRSSDINKMFSLGAGSSLSLQGLQTEILALRSRVPQERLAEFLRTEDTQTGNSRIDSGASAEVEADRQSLERARGRFFDRSV